jgi:hypothetical protein
MKIHYFWEKKFKLVAQEGENMVKGARGAKVKVLF